MSSIFVASLATLVAIAGLQLVSVKPAAAQSQDIVTSPLSPTELFERAVLGRGLDPEWDGRPLDLLLGNQIELNIVVENDALRSDSTLDSQLKSLESKVKNVGFMATHAEFHVKLNYAAVDSVNSFCADELAGNLSRSPSENKNSITFVVGLNPNKCLLSLEALDPAVSGVRLDPAISDDDLTTDSGAGLLCASRSIKPVAKSPADGNGRFKSTLIVAGLPKKAGAAQSMTYCFYDRYLSFFGFRGRILFQPIGGAPPSGAGCASLRCWPIFEIYPTGADLFMLETAYRYLVNSSYDSHKDEISLRLEKNLP